MVVREEYKNFEFVINNEVLIIRNIGTGEEGRASVKGKDKDDIIKMAHFIIDKRVEEILKEEKSKEVYKEVCFCLELRSGERYNHSYLVPERIVKLGGRDLEEYIVLEAMGDLISIEVEEIESIEKERG